MDTNGNEEEEEAEDKPTYIAGTISILHDFMRAYTGYCSKRTM